jgi:hypothetical protein
MHSFTPLNSSSSSSSNGSASSSSSPSSSKQEDKKVEARRASFIKSERNKVTIRVWLRQLGKRVGHASLQTHRADGIYASFWPNDDSSKRQSSRDGVAAAHIRTPKQDEINESIERNANGFRIPCPSDVTIELYGLNVDKIQEEYKKFRESNCNWSLWGSSFFRKENTRNCSGLTEFLLRCGGIYDIINCKHRKKAINITAPITGVLTGAASGAVIGGPPGALIGGVIGGLHNSLLHHYCDTPIHAHSISSITSEVGAPISGLYGLIAGASSGMIAGPLGAVAGGFMGLIGGLVSGGAAGALIGCASEETEGFITPDGVAYLTQIAKQCEDEEFYQAVEAKDAILSSSLLSSSASSSANHSSSGIGGRFSLLPPPAVLSSPSESSINSSSSSLSRAAFNI